MTEYNKHNSIAALISELCTPLDYAEYMLLFELSAKMGQDSEFAHQYLSEIKKDYIKHWSAIKTNTYKKVEFKNLHIRYLTNITKETKITNQQPLKETPEDIAERISLMLNNLKNSK